MERRNWSAFFRGIVPCTLLGAINAYDFPGVAIAPRAICRSPRWGQKICLRRGKVGASMMVLGSQVSNHVPSLRSHEVHGTRRASLAHFGSSGPILERSITLVGSANLYQ
jgi:hypothetical protein